MTTGGGHPSRILPRAYDASRCCDHIRDSNCVIVPSRHQTKCSSSYVQRLLYAVHTFSSSVNQKLRIVASRLTLDNPVLWWTVRDLATAIVRDNFAGSVGVDLTILLHGHYARRPRERLMLQLAW